MNKQRMTKVFWIWIQCSFTHSALISCRHEYCGSQIPGLLQKVNISKVTASEMSFYHLALFESHFWQTTYWPGVEDIHTKKNTQTHSHSYTHLSDIRSLYCPLKFSSSQISIDERVSIKHVWDPARNPELWTSYLHHSLYSSAPSFSSSPPPAPSLLLLLSETEPPSGFLHRSPLLPFLSPSPVCVAFGKLANCVLLTWVHVLSGDQLFV